MIPGQNSTLNCDPNPRSQINVESWLGGHNSTWNSDLGSQFHVESRLGVTIQHGIMTRVKFKRGILTWITDQRGILTRGHISTWNYDPRSQFNMELWPRVKIPHWIMTPGQNFTLKFDPSPGSQSYFESWLEVKIQREIKTWGHNSTWNQDPGSQLNDGSKFYPSGVVIQWPPCLGGRNSTWKICWILSTARWIKTPQVEIQWGQNSILHRQTHV